VNTPGNTSSAGKNFPAPSIYLYRGVPGRGNEKLPAFKPGGYLRPGGPGYQHPVYKKTSPADQLAAPGPDAKPEEGVNIPLCRKSNII